MKYWFRRMCGWIVVDPCKKLLYRCGLINLVWYDIGDEEPRVHIIRYSVGKRYIRYREQVLQLLPDGEVCNMSWIGDQSNHNTWIGWAPYERLDPKSSIWHTAENKAIDMKDKLNG